ncbi:2-C-methyl-D-erythritol 4-phosphate cytidylyltransferase [bacterium]|nr:2-C-methyl-D-erythritol 4-phosphate cytidylyltransferase [bacterium]
MNIAAILLCAGTSERFGGKTPKQFHMLGEKKLYRYCLDTIMDAKTFSSITLVIGDKQESYLDHHVGIQIVQGGKTRQESVRLALESIQSADFIMILEAVRPFLTKELIYAHLEKIEQGEIAINTCIPATDTINIQKEGKIIAIPERKQFLQGQTPQTFSYHKLHAAHKHTSKTYTDDCGIMLDIGENVSYVLGSSRNIKITTPFDLQLATHLALNS